MVLQLVGCGRVGHCQPFLGGGGVDPVDRGRHPHHFCLWSRRSGIVGGVLDFLTYPLLLCSQLVGRNVWGVVVGTTPHFYVFMGRLLLKVVKDTPAIRRQTY